MSQELQTWWKLYENFCAATIFLRYSTTHWRQRSFRFICLCVRHVVIADCIKLKVASLEWPQVA